MSLFGWTKCWRCGKRVRKYRDGSLEQHRIPGTNKICGGWF